MPHPKKGLTFEGYGSTHPAESQQSPCLWTKRASSMECDGSDQRRICHTSEWMCSGTAADSIPSIHMRVAGGGGGSPDLGSKTESY